MTDSWLPPGRRAAVCLTVDDVHPSRSTDAYEAGGDLGEGALGHIEWLLDRHPQLAVTLFVTPDWREISPVPTRRFLTRLPGLRDRMFLAPTLAPGTMRLDRHPRFVEYLLGLPRTEIALHGLHHVNRGRNIPVEFRGRSAEECEGMLRDALQIFADAGLPGPHGMTPPGWEASPALLAALAEVDLKYVASARDIETEPAPGAVTAMSGLNGTRLLEPQQITDRNLVHIPTNFQATSPPDRAFQIVDAGGLLSIKAHVIKDCLGHVALDGLDVLYRNYLDSLFCQLEHRYGDELWWATMGAVAACATATGDRRRLTPSPLPE